MGLLYIIKRDGHRYVFLGSLLETNQSLLVYGWGTWLTVPPHNQCTIGYTRPLSYSTNRRGDLRVVYISIYLLPPTSYGVSLRNEFLHPNKFLATSDKSWTDSRGHLSLYLDFKGPHLLETPSPTTLVPSLDQKQKPCTFCGIFTYDLLIHKFRGGYLRIKTLKHYSLNYW